MTIHDIPEGGTAGRLRLQLAELQRFYGLLAMPPNDAFALFVWVVLSEKATPAGRDAAIASLRRVHALTPDAITRAPRAILEAAVAPAGQPVDLRVDALRAGADVFRRRRALTAAVRGSLPGARRAVRVLTELDAASAHRMLLFAGDHAIVPVDAAVRRVVLRLGYTRPGKMTSARGIRRILGAMLDGDLDACRHVAVYLSHHAALMCTERDPHCRVCPLAPECPEALAAPSAKLS